eukprot:759825-Hanusia_phi.AAC.12
MINEYDISEVDQSRYGGHVRSGINEERMSLTNVGLSLIAHLSCMRRDGSSTRNRPTLPSPPPGRRLCSIARTPGGQSFTTAAPNFVSWSMTRIVSLAQCGLRAKASESSRVSAAR